MAIFLVILHRSGPSWEPGLALEEQSGWAAHAAFMDGLVDSGFVILGGPLSDEQRVALAVEAGSEAAVRATLGRDPWSGTHLVLGAVDAWTIRLDGRRPSIGHSVLQRTRRGLPPPGRRPLAAGVCRWHRPPPRRCPVDPRRAVAAAASPHRPVRSQPRRRRRAAVPQPPAWRADRPSPGSGRRPDSLRACTDRARRGTGWDRPIMWGTHDPSPLRAVPARAPSIPRRAHLGAARRPPPHPPGGPSARLSPPPHPGPGGRRPGGRGPGLRRCLLARRGRQLLRDHPAPPSGRVDRGRGDGAAGGTGGPPGRGRAGPGHGQPAAETPPPAAAWVSQ